MGPTKHCRLSPSSSKRWLTCPYSAQADLPDVVSGEDRTGGRAKTVGVDVHHLAGEVLADRAPLSDVPLEWETDVRDYVEHVRANGGEYLVEHFWESLVIDEFGGTTDCTILDGNKCAVYDFKTGKWPVDAANNPQLMCYCAIIAEHYCVDEFYGVIVQPRAFKGDKIKVAEYTLGDIDKHREKVRSASTQDYKNAGDHCRFCSLRLIRRCQEGIEYGQHKGWKL